MCGIVGTFDLVSGLPSAETLVVRMTDSLAHRGPDDAGVLIDAPVALGNRRLAIFDLSPRGHQPMASADGRYRIAYNGEVYNWVELAAELRGLGYRFRSASDTEVVVAAYSEWGPAALDRFNGEFGLAIWDCAARELFLARDRFGIKGLYWTVAGGRFRFASEIKALFADPAVPRVPNDARVLDFLAHELADHTAETMFDGVSQLRPGTWLRVAAQGVGRPVTWYRPQPVSLEGRDPVAAVRDLLIDAVRLRLRSDVPVGVALSGGIDSASVLSIAAQLRATDGGGAAPDSFTARCSDSRIDEGPWAAKALAGTGSSNYQLLPDDANLLADLDTLLWHMDEPFHSPTVYGHWKVLELARARGVTVLLEGQGGDEVFGGYHYLYPAMLYSLLRRGDVRAAMREVSVRTGVHGVPPRQTVADLAKLLLPPGLRGRRVPDWIVPGARVAPRPLPGRSLAAHQLHCLTVTPLPAFLHHDDRNSMSVSLEARPPFLDHRLVELGLGLAPGDVLRDGMTKRAVREAMRGIVAQEILDRSAKQGFSVDQGAWLLGTLGDAVADTLRSRELAGRPYFAPAALERLLAEHRAGADRSRDIWRAFVVERWLRLFVDPARLEALDGSVGAARLTISAGRRVERLAPAPRSATGAA